MARWIGVDLDGTLAKSVSSLSSSIGEPIQPMLSRVKGWLARGQEVRIFTARASDQKQISSIRNWLNLHGIGDCGITNSKDLDMIELYDDKAKRVVKDQGRICSGCRSNKHGSLGSGMQYSSEDEALTDC